MSITPNMNMQLPSVTVTTGPEWASELNTALNVVDAHDHTSSNGTKVPVAGLDINQDFPLSSHRITEVASAQLNNRLSTLSGATNANSIAVYNGDIYFTNSGGVPVQITSGNSIVSNVIIPPSPLMPAGVILDFAGGTVPSGFLLCDGAAVSRTTYSDLFSAIGTVYGAGNGTTTFNIPDAAGRAAVGKGTYTDSVLGSITRSIGQLVGAAAHVLITGEMPSHTHTQNSHNHGMHPTNSGSFSTGNVMGAGNGATPGTATTDSVTAVNNNTGGGASHNNMQPSLVVTKMIKY